MKKTNLQKSEVVIARILTFLEEKGIQSEIQLRLGNLELEAEYVPFYDGCCRWLLDEGILRGSHNPLTDGGNFLIHNAIITARGFALLGQPFPIAQEEISLGQAVEKVAQGKANYAGVGEVFGGILGGFTKSFGS